MKGSMIGPGAHAVALENIVAEMGTWTNRAKPIKRPGNSSSTPGPIHRDLFLATTNGRPEITFLKLAQIS